VALPTLIRKGRRCLLDVMFADRRRWPALSCR
jgi:hypothetical protein